MADKFLYIPNDDTLNNPFFRLKLMVETFEHSTKWTSQSKFNKSPQSCQANKYHKTLETNVIGKQSNILSLPPTLPVWSVMWELYLIFANRIFVIKVLKLSW